VLRIASHHHPYRIIHKTLILLAYLQLAGATVQFCITMSWFTGKILPLFIYPTLVALAQKSLFTDAFPQALPNQMAEVCKSGSYLQREVGVTGHPAFDDVLCGIVAFFNAGLTNSMARPYFIECLTSLAPIMVFLFLEAARHGRSFILSSVCITIFSLSCQLFSGAVGFPIYWLLFLITGRSRRVGHLDRAYAEATFFAFVIGFLLPTTAMFVTDDVQLMAAWQFFPFFMLIAQRFHLLIRPGKAYKSGRRTAQTLYALTFVVSALPHFALVWPLRDDMPALMNEFVPRRVAPTEEITLADGARNFLQWDGAFIALSALLTTFWSARSLKEAIVIALWNVCATSTMGLGGALSALYAWREEHVTPL